MKTVSFKQDPEIVSLRLESLSSHDSNKEPDLVLDPKQAQYMQDGNVYMTRIDNCYKLNRDQVKEHL